MATDFEAATDLNVRLGRAAWTPAATEAVLAAAFPTLAPEDIAACFREASRRLIAEANELER